MIMRGIDPCSGPFFFLLRDDNCNSLYKMWLPMMADGALTYKSDRKRNEREKSIVARRCLSAAKERCVSFELRH